MLQGANGHVLSSLSDRQLEHFINFAGSGSEFWLNDSRVHGEKRINVFFG